MQILNVRVCYKSYSVGQLHIYYVYLLGALDDFDKVQLPVNQQALPMKDDKKNDSEVTSNVKAAGPTFRHSHRTRRQTPAPSFS